MLEWTVSGWIIAGLLGFVTGILAERYIGRVERRQQEVEERRQAMGEKADDDTKVTRVGKRRR